MYRKLCTVVVFLALFNACLGLLQWTRLNPHIVEDGTHIDKNETHVSFYEPSGRISHFPHAEFDTEHYGRHNVTTSIQGTSKRDSTSSGWVSSFWAWGSSFTYMTSQWTVPPAPIHTASNIIFFFNSLEGATPGGSGSDILQPVLQYNNGVGGWTLASWYGSGSYTESTPVAVNVGDTITGIMQLSNGVWSVLGYVNGVLKTTLTISQSAFNNGDAQNTAQWALEVYNMPDCTYYPPNNFLSLTNIVLQDNGGTVANPSFSVPGTNAHGCNAAGYTTSTPGQTSASSSVSTLTITWDSTTTSLGAAEAIASIGVDVAGGDIGTVSAGSALACAQACDGNANCNGWAWDNQGKVTCWLKSTINGRSQNSARTSGVKQGKVGVDRSGNDLPGYPLNLPAGSTAATCAAYCNGNAACQSWAFNTCGTQCWLKDAVGTESANSCRTSGVKGVLYTDHVGGDFAQSTLGNAADSTQCANLCASTSGCSNWAYVYPGAGCNTANVCYLKTGGLVFPSVNSCTVSGNVH